MSTPLSPAARWPSAIAQADIPANNNARRMDIMNGPALSATETAPPGSPADGDVYILPASPTGDWSTFDEDDIVVFYAGTGTGTWTAFAPTNGLTMYVVDEGTNWQFTTGGGWAAEAAGSVDADDVAYDNSTSGLAATDAQAAIDEIAAALGTSSATVSALANVAGVVDIDCALGDYFTLTLAANVTSITFSNLPGSGKGASKMLRIIQGAGPYTVAWPASFKWAGGTTGAISAVNAAVDVLALTTFDNGTSWDATLAKAFA